MKKETFITHIDKRYMFYYLREIEYLEDKENTIIETFLVPILNEKMKIITYGKRSPYRGKKMLEIRIEEVIDDLIAHGKEIPKEIDEDDFIEKYYKDSNTHFDHINIVRKEKVEIIKPKNFNMFLNFDEE